MGKSFKISFDSNKILDIFSGGELFKYTATVTIMSQSLGLYKVSNIERSDNFASTLSDTFYITNYPLENNKDLNWRDPISRSTSNFLSLIGEKIEESIRQSISVENLVFVD
jgi:hypothetical protein